MTQRALLNALLPIFAFTFLSDGYAMSRHHDGDARAWIRDGALCVGAAESYAVPGFFSSEARLDQNQVTLHAVSLSRLSTQVWEVSAAAGAPSSTVQLRPDTCLQYGQPVATLETRVLQDELEPGVHEVFLQASDQKNRRVLLYKRFCLVGEAGNWAVTDAERIEGSHGWRCKTSRSRQTP